MKISMRAKVVVGGSYVTKKLLTMTVAINHTEEILLFSMKKVDLFFAL